LETVPHMAGYAFRIRHGTPTNEVLVNAPNDDAAWHDAAAVCSDMIRDTILRLKDSPEWRLEVVDEAGTIRHLFRLTVKIFEP
jgi:hypothetical protein